MALLVGMIVKSGLSDKSAPAAQILVAAKPLKVGQDLVAADVKWQNWPQDSINAGMIVRKDKKQAVAEVAKGQVRRDIGVGEPVLSHMIATGGKGNILAAALEPGMRAVAIKVKAESMVGGFIAPGDRVDVIMTYEVKTDDKDMPQVQKKVQKYASETILENVRVLAIDQQARKEDDKAKVGRTVTLEVDAKGAERLNLASAMSEEGLTLSLRAMGDDKTTDAAHKTVTTDTDISTVLQEINSMRAAGGAVQPGGGTPGVVRVYNGENVQNVAVPGAAAPSAGQ